MKKTLILQKTLILLLLVLFGLLTGCTTGAVIADQTLRVGVILPLSGAGAFFGTETQQGIDLCVEKTTFLYADSETSPVKGVSAFKELSLQDIDAGIVTFSSISSAVIPVAQESKIPMLLTTVSSIDEEILNNKDVFRYFTSAEQESPLLAELVYNQGFRDVGILYLQDDYGLSYKDVFIQNFKGTVSETESFLGNEIDFRTQLQKMKDVEVIFIVGHDPHVLAILRASKQMGLSTRFVTNWVAASDQIREKAPKLFEDVLLTSPSYYFAPSNEAKEFVTQYEKTFKITPSAYAAIGCDIAKIFDSYGLDFLKIERFSGIMGDLSANENGDIRFDLFQATIKNNTLVLLN